MANLPGLDSFHRSPSGLTACPHAPLSVLHGWRAATTLWRQQPCRCPGNSGAAAALFLSYQLPSAAQHGQAVRGSLCPSWLPSLRPAAQPCVLRKPRSRTQDMAPISTARCWELSKKTRCCRQHGNGREGSTCIPSAKSPHPEHQQGMHTRELCSWRPQIPRLLHHRHHHAKPPVPHDCQADSGRDHAAFAIRVVAVHLSNDEIRWRKTCRARHSNGLPLLLPQCQTHSCYPLPRCPAY